jgi:anthranilate phosphoribosyltransferase
MPDMDFSRAIDVSGTGGDGLKTINVGTVASFVMAAAGLTVGKQSTRGYTGLLGSLDLLGRLGIEVKYRDEQAARVERLLERERLAFYCHPAFNKNYANQGRFFTELKERKLAFVTPWHLLFWVFNPLPLSYRVYGMFTGKYSREVAEVLLGQGIKRGWVVSGGGGMDEVSVLGSSKVVEFGPNGLKEFEVQPGDFGVKKVELVAVTVANADEAVVQATELLQGKREGPLRDLVAVNAATGLYLAGVVSTLREGNELAIETLKSGKAWYKYRDYKLLALGRRF